MRNFKTIVLFSLIFMKNNFAFTAASHHEEGTKSFGKTEHHREESAYSIGKARDFFSSKRETYKETPEEYRARKERIAQEKHEKPKKETPEEYKERIAQEKHEKPKKETPEEYRARKERIAQEKHEKPKKETPEEYRARKERIAQEKHEKPKPAFSSYPTRTPELPIVNTYRIFLDDITFDVPSIRTRSIYDLPSIRTRRSTVQDTKTTGYYETVQNTRGTETTVEGNVFGWGAYINGVFIPHNEV